MRRVFCVACRAHRCRATLLANLPSNAMHPGRLVGGRRWGGWGRGVRIRHSMHKVGPDEAKREQSSLTGGGHSRIWPSACCSHLPGCLRLWPKLCPRRGSDRPKWSTRTKRSHGLAQYREQWGAPTVQFRQAPRRPWQAACCACSGSLSSTNTGNKLRREEWNTDTTGKCFDWQCTQGHVIGMLQ